MALNNAKVNFWVFLDMICYFSGNKTSFRIFWKIFIGAGEITTRPWKRLLEAGDITTGPYKQLLGVGGDVTRH